MLLLWALSSQGFSPAPSYLMELCHWPLLGFFAHLKSGSGFSWIQLWLLLLTTVRREGKFEVYKCTGRFYGFRNLCCIFHCECILSCSFQNKLNRASLWLNNAMNEKHFKTLPSHFLLPTISFIPTLNLTVWVFGGFLLQIVFFVFITKLRNKILTKQFVQKTIKRQNVFLLLAG